MSTIYIFLTIMALAYTEELPKGGYKYFTIGHGTFKFHKDDVTWQQAKERCAGAGTELWVPADEAEQRAVRGEVDRVMSGIWIWTGINDLNNPGAYSAPDGRPLSIDRDRWYANQPKSDGGALRCVALTHNPYLYVGDCAWTLPYLCRLPAASAPAPAATPPSEHNQTCASYNYQEEIDNSKRLGYEESELSTVIYKLHVVPATWNDAHTRCIQEGAQLTSPINGEFLKEMIRVMKTKNIDGGVLTGIHDKITPGQYSSIEGVPLRKILVPWRERLQYSGVSDVIVLRRNEKLDLASHNDAYPFICYKNISNTTTGNSSCNTGYMKDNTTGVYYNIHKERRTWSEAAAVCAAREGSHLAIITKRMEAAALLGRLLAAESELAFSAEDLFFVGISDWGSPNGWLTVHGQTVPDFEEPASGLQKPENAQEQALCGALLQSGALVAVDCNKTQYFLCQIDTKYL